MLGLNLSNVIKQDDAFPQGLNYLVQVLYSLVVFSSDLGAWSEMKLNQIIIGYIHFLFILKNDEILF